MIYELNCFLGTRARPSTFAACGPDPDRTLLRIENTGKVALMLTLAQKDGQPPVPYSPVTAKALDPGDTMEWTGDDAQQAVNGAVSPGAVDKASLKVTVEP
jgi:hypothetical protein